MKWKYTLHVDSSLEQIYRLVEPGRWMSFYLPRFYRGVEEVDTNWPETGSSILIRYGLGPFKVNIRQTITQHRLGRSVRIREDVLHGLWTDENEITFRRASKGGYAVTITSDQASNFWPLWWLGPIRWLLNWLDLPPAFQRFKAMAEGSPLTKRGI